MISCCWLFFFSSRRRHTRLQGDWSSDVCSSDLVHRLDDDATMSYLHRCCSTKRHPVATPRAPVFLGHYLADEPLIGGEEPILGQQHLRVISVKTWPKGLWPGILHALDDLPLEYRLSLRWLPL